MTWNYRVTCEGGEYTIRECYYDEDGEVEGWTDPVHAIGDNEDELEDDLMAMLRAFDQDVVYIDTQEVSDDEEE